MRKKKKKNSTLYIPSRWDLLSIFFSFHALFVSFQKVHLCILHNSFLFLRAPLLISLVFSCLSVIFIKINQNLSLTMSICLKSKHPISNHSISQHSQQLKHLWSLFLLVHYKTEYFRYFTHAFTLIWWFIIKSLF